MRLQRSQLYLPLVTLVLVGFGVRIATMATYSTAVFAWQDSLRFLRLAPYAPETGLFDDPWMPAGYPMFLGVLRTVTDQLWFTVGVQHVIGMVAAIALYAALRRLDCPRWVATVPAAALLLSGEFIYAEHSLMTEALVTSLLACGLFLVVRGARDTGSPSWLAGAGIVLGAAVLVRNVSLLVLPIVAVWLLVVLDGTWRARLARAASFAGVAGLVVLTYAAVATSGRYSGLGELSGWFSYGRAAPFADCNQFEPGPRLAVLCERSNPATRLGPFHYVNDVDNPGRQNFDLLPWACAAARPGRVCRGSQQEHVGAFARKAIVAQPLGYLRAVAKDLTRFADPGVGVERERWGSVPEQNAFGAEDLSIQPEIARRTDERYDGVDADRGRFAWLETYQRTLRLGGLELTLAVLLTLAGVALGRGLARRGAVLFGACAIAMYLGPVASFSYDARYGLPGQPLLIAAAALGAWALARRRHGPADPAGAVA